MLMLIALLAVVAPRVTIIVFALFTDVFTRTFDGLLLPILGFLFLPVTTLAYVAAVHFAGGVEGSMWIVVMIIAVLIDLGGFSWQSRRYRRDAA